MNQEISKSFNNNTNSVINIVKEVLGEDAQEYIITRLASQIIEYFERYTDNTNEKLDELLNNKSFTDNLMRQINKATEENSSLLEQLAKSQKEHEALLDELEKIKSEQIDNNDIDFKKVIEEAEKALENYDSEKYQEVLTEYRENKKHKELVKNIATTHYLSAKNYAGDFYFEKAQKEINKAIVLDETNGDYAGWYGFILLHLAKYEEALQYLEQSLKIRQEIGDKSGEGATLNNISQIYDARGDYTTALKYLEQSLEITQEIGDVAGLCATLFNMGHIHLQNDEVPEAIEKWVSVYKLAKQINLAQVLEALEGLAGQLGLENGLESWEQLAQQFNQ